MNSYERVLFSPGAPLTWVMEELELGQIMPRDDSVLTWDHNNMDQGGVESKEQECHKMAQCSPGTPLT
jgi:hypothetical protein